MTDAGDIIGPIGSLAAIGVLAYGAKTVIDVMKDKAQAEDKKRKPRALYQERYEQTPRPEANNRIDRGLNKMLGRQ